MKFQFVIKGEIDADSLEDAKDWIMEGLKLDAPTHFYFDSIFPKSDHFARCIAKPKGLDRQCLNHKRFGDLCGIHNKLK